MQLLNEFLKRNRERKLKIHCAGDALIDEYFDISIKRISPEAPVMVMSSPNNSAVRRPGGAANVVYQFKHFNVDPLLICWCDELGKSVFVDHQIQWVHSLASQCCSLPIKRRFLDGGVQVVRHDIELPLCGLSEHVIDFATLQIRNCIEKTFKPDVAILSDYNKGFFSSEEHRVIDFYRDIKTIVDPKIGPLSKWKGCTIFKPNANEAMNLTGRTQWKEQAKHLQNELECEAVVITSGGNDVSGIWYDDFFTFKPDRSVKVESVVGAGDCFVAFFAMAIGHGFSVPEAAEIAWSAGANYVKNKRNRPIIPAELSLDGIVSPSDLVSRDFKLVFTNGCFDFGLTAAHVECFKFAKEQGDKLVVAINSDDSVRRLKGEGRPILSFSERAKIVSALECVDYVIGFDNDTPLEVIKKIMPSVIVKGGDYTIDEVVGKDFAEVKIFPYIKATSTTDKIKRLSESEEAKSSPCT